MQEFEGWDSFYLIVGAAAGALIGLQFVVMTLIADQPRQPQAMAGNAFATPTIVHFSVSLWLCALVRTPWWSVTPFAVLAGVTGILGSVYSIVVIRRMRMQTTYTPELQDWLFYAGLPIVGYGFLLAASITAKPNITIALYAVAASSLLLLFLGIHNAWDTVTYHVFLEETEGRVGEDT